MWNSNCKRRQQNESVDKHAFINMMKQEWSKISTFLEMLNLYASNAKNTNILLKQTNIVVKETKGL